MFTVARGIAFRDGSCQHWHNKHYKCFTEAGWFDTNSAGVGTDLVYRDPWGNPYVITMDLNYDDQCQDAFYSLKGVSQQSGQSGFNSLGNSTDPNGNGNNFRYHGKVMVWSAGPDGKIDRSASARANTGFNKDNVLSWQ